MQAQQEDDLGQPTNRDAGDCGSQEVPPSMTLTGRRKAFRASRSRGCARKRRASSFLAALLLAPLALAISAVACEGVPGPPAQPTPPEVGGAGSNPGSPGLNKDRCGKTVDCATGDEATQETDIAIGGRGPGLSIVRSYDALASAQAQAEGKGIGLWGWGWTGPYEESLTLASEGGMNTATVYQQNGSAAVFYETEAGEYTQGGWTLARIIKTGSKYIYTLPDQSKLEFNSEGRLVKETDRNGNANTLTYNESKQLEKVTDGAGKTLTFKYNGEGLVESIKDPRGDYVSYAYTAKILSTVTIEGKARWEFGYGAAAPHLLGSVTDGRKHTTTIEYDGSHRVIKETIAGHERKWSYSTGKTTITEPNGSETVDTFNAAEEPTKIVQAKGTGAERVTEYEYSGTTFELVKMIDPNKHVTEYGYDEEGNRTSEKDPSGDERKWEYDANHNVISEATPEGETTTIKRTASGEPEIIERPAGSETQKAVYKYNEHGDVAELIDPLSHTTKYTYNAAGMKEAEKDAEGNERKWKYNEDYAVTEETNARGYKTKIEHNEANLPIKVTVPTGQSTQYKYDGNQNVETEVDRLKHTTKYAYNEDNLRTKVTKPNGDISETGYDAEGQMTSRTDGNGHTWEYKRNQLEQVTEEKNPLGKIWKKTYDQAGNLETLEDPEKNVTEYGYDETNRRTKVKYSTGTPSEVTFEYNKDGKVTKMKDETGTTGNAWDKLDRLTEYKNGTGKVVKYEYNLTNLPIKITYPNGEHITQEYDKDNRLGHVTDWKSKTTSFTYNADSEPATTIFPAGTENKDEYSYNEDDVMKEVKMLQGATILGSIAYTHDGAGQIKTTTSKSFPGPEKTESIIDENHRLIENNKQPYEYDKANNPKVIGGLSGHTYNSADELVEGPEGWGPEYKYTYNEDGERVGSASEGQPGFNYTYDQAGNLATAERYGKPEEELKESYTYDGNNLRQAQTINGVHANFTWNTAQPLPELIDDETNSYIYGPGGLPIEQVPSGGETLYFHHDQQGSTRLLTNTKGESAGKFSYESFGLLRSGSSENTPLRYDAQYTSKSMGALGTELVYLRARTYDPTTAQFLSIDPAMESTGEAYAYVRDNPENNSDPTGTCATPTLPVINWTKVVEGCIKGGTKGFIVAGLTGQVEAIPTTVVIGCLTGAVFKLWDQLAENEPGIRGELNKALGTALEFITGDATEGGEIIQEAPAVLSGVWNFWVSDWVRWFRTL